MPSYVYRVTKYDPADRDRSGRYIGTAETISDRGPVEAAYLRAVAAFAEEAGVERLAVREPEVAASARFGEEPAESGLEGLFPPDLAGFHDGAEVTVAVALELVRAMLRENGAWCRLETDSFAVHVGWDQYVYIGADTPCEGALARTRALGLFPERLDASPYDADFTEYEGEQRPADDDFWARLRWLVATGRAGILEERLGANCSRWHRLTVDTVDAVRARLAPRAQLYVWPDLSADVEAVAAGLPEEGLVEAVWEDRDGRISDAVADETEFGELAERLRGARAAAVRPLADEPGYLFSAVLPDGDGVLRARWRTEPTPSDRQWSAMRRLRRGQVCTGTVMAIPDFGVTFVDVGGATAMINIPELSWRRIEWPTEVVSVGQEVTTLVLDVDMVRERVALSLRALQDDQMRELARQVGQVVRGRVTKVVPFGVFVLVEDRDDGYEGLLRHEDGDEADDQVGDLLEVVIVNVEPERRRITLARA